MNADTFQLMLALLGLALTAVGALTIWILSKIWGSVEKLNVKMAVMCERVETHDSRLVRLETHHAV